MLSVSEVTLARRPRTCEPYPSLSGPRRPPGVGPPAGHRPRRAARGHRHAAARRAARPHGVRRVGGRALRLPAGRRTPGSCARSTCVPSSTGRSVGTRRCRPSGSTAWSTTWTPTRRRRWSRCCTTPVRPTSGPGRADGSPPLLDFEGPGGLQQRVWRVPPGRVTEALAEELAAADHYIADGHHRVAAALAEWRRRRARRPRSCASCTRWTASGSPRSTAASRPGRRAELSAARTGFTVEPCASAPALDTGSFGLYAERLWYVVTPRTAGDGLDVEVLHDAGARPPRPDASRSRPRHLRRLARPAAATATRACSSRSRRHRSTRSPGWRTPVG